MAGVGASNVIPDVVEMLGTIRAVTATHFATLRRRVGDVAAAVAGAHGCVAHMEWSPRPYLPTVNDAGLVDLVAQPPPPPPPKHTHTRAHAQAHADAHLHPAFGLAKYICV